MVFDQMARVGDKRTFTTKVEALRSEASLAEQFIVTRTPQLRRRPGYNGIWKASLCPSGKTDRHSKVQAEVSLFAASVGACALCKLDA